MCSWNVPPVSEFNGANAADIHTTQWHQVTTSLFGFLFLVFSILQPSKEWEKGSRKVEATLVFVYFLQISDVWIDLKRLFFAAKLSKKQKSKRFTCLSKIFAHTKGQKRKFYLHTSNCTPSQNIRIKWRHLAMTNKLRSAFAVVFASGREANGAEKYSTSVSEVEKEHVNFDAGRWQRDTRNGSQTIIPSDIFSLSHKMFQQCHCVLARRCQVNRSWSSWLAVTARKSLGFVVELIVQLLLVLHGDYFAAFCWHLANDFNTQPQSFKSLLTFLHKKHARNILCTTETKEKSQHDILFLNRGNSCSPVDIFESTST